MTVHHFCKKRGTLLLSLVTHLQACPAGGMLGPSGSQNFGKLLSAVGSHPSDRDIAEVSLLATGNTLQQEERGTPSGLPSPSNALGLTQLCCHLVFPVSSSTRAMVRPRTPWQKNTF